MDIIKRINFRQPKYMLPAILYVPLLVASYFIFDLFHTEKAEIPNKTLQTTEFLNPGLPDAQTKGGMNRNTRKTTSPCSASRSRKRLWWRKLPMPRSVSKKLSRNWRKHSPRRG